MDELGVGIIISAVVAALVCLCLGNIKEKE